MGKQIHPVNGQKHIRVRDSEGCTVLPCGCAHAEVMWLQLCDEHYQELMRERREAYLSHRARANTVKASEDKR